ncbi:MAG: hypothetical protein KKF30_07560 [Proteobacteria bacterium]|nr:hypothetical protein [Pseudomonadota bacterium]MBU4470275.1 hypothetical protein [Pseudomonadota bacterium]
MKEKPTRETRISGKDLAALNMPDFCPRCFWIKRKTKALPYQIFPGIFSTIDGYTKALVHAHFDTYGIAPASMAEALGEAQDYLKPPSWQKFQRRDDVTGIIVSGSLDGYFIREDGSRIIPDYKTAKHTEGQDKLLPLYEAQLNAYRWIDEGFGNVVHSTPLIYCEPQALDTLTSDPRFIEDPYRLTGFEMLFSTKTVFIENKPDLIPSLLVRAKEILDMPEAPDSSEGCKDCEKLDDLVRLVVNG